ncbi:MAG: hypothetical protein U0930_25505 [Pirellulales bacterium]
MMDITGLGSTGKSVNYMSYSRNIDTASSDVGGYKDRYMSGETLCAAFVEHSATYCREWLSPENPPDRVTLACAIAAFGSSVVTMVLLTPSSPNSEISAFCFRVVQNLTV